MTTKAPSGLKVKTYPYEHFQGVDTSRDVGAMDTGDKQSLTRMHNGYCDWRGVITRDPSSIKRPNTEGLITHVAFFGRDLSAFSVRQGGGISLVSDRGHTLSEVYPRGGVVTSTNFNQKVVMACRGAPLYEYDGLAWSKVQSSSNPRPGIVTTVARRLAASGFGSRRTEIQFSRVDDETVFPDDEDKASSAVTKAVRLDIKNLIGTADEIKGMAAFENSRFAIFTQDRTLIYNLDPDYTKWSVDDKSNIRVGTVSHNSIAVAGGDVFFASRSGVFSLRRSDANGLVISNVPMSAKIDLLYRSIIRQTPNLEEISGFYDIDNGQYHLFFPQSDLLSRRLTMTLSPDPQDPPKWSTGDFLNARCGTSLGGVVLLGTPGGVYQQFQVEDELPLIPDMLVETPTLWLGGLTDVKQSHSIILQAAGKGTVIMEGFDENGRALSDVTFDIDTTTEDDVFLDIPLSMQYDRKFEHRFKGVRFRISVRGSGLIRIIGFAINVRSKI